MAAKINLAAFSIVVTVYLLGSISFSVSMTVVASQHQCLKINTVRNTVRCRVRLEATTC